MQVTEAQCKENFNRARQLYPGRKRGLDTEWKAFKGWHKNWRDLLDDDGLERCVIQMKTEKAYDKAFWPHWKTFCYNSEWEQVMPDE